MIYDKISNLHKYQAIVPNYQEILDLNFAKMATGKHNLANENFCMVFDTTLTDKTIFEYHQKFIDIHMPLTESEKVAFATGKLDVVTSPYNDQDDAALGKMNNATCEIIVKPGEFILFLPYEIHAPKLIINKIKSQRRAVVKVKI